MTNQFIGIATIALRRCNADLVNLVHVFLGSIVFMVVYSVLLLNGLESAGFVNYTPLSGAGEAAFTILAITVFLSIIGAFCLISFLCILIALLVYTIVFLHTCYVYDGRTWEMVNYPKQIFHNMILAWKRDNDRVREESREFRKELESEIEKLKSGKKDISSFALEE